MSAFIVSNTHIDFILTGVMTDARTMCIGSELSWWTPGGTDGYGVKAALHIGTADQVGQMLLDENTRSVNYRYSEEEPSPAYEFKRYEGDVPLTMGNILNAVRCLDYQSCETPDWQQTEAHRFCRAVIDMYIEYLAEGANEQTWDMWKERDE